MKAADVEKVLHELGCHSVRTMPTGKVKSSCPFATWRHTGGTDSHPSFVVWSDDKKASGYYCAGCKARGNTMLSLVWRVQDMSGRDMSDLVEFVGKADGWLDPAERVKQYEYKPRADSDEEWRPPERKVPELRQIPEKNYAPFSEMVSPYFLKRGLTEETCRAWGLGDDPRRKRALFAIRDRDGRLFGISGRLYEEVCCGVPYSEFEKNCPKCGRKKQPKYLHSKGFRKGLILYGEHMIDLKIRVGIVVEGNIDPIAVWQAGYRNPVAIMGSEPSRTQCEKLVGFFDRLVVVPDGDAAGREMGRKTEKLLGKRMPVVVKFPPDGKDPANLGVGGLERLLGKPFLV